MKSNLRNEIKSYIIRQGMTMQEVVDFLFFSQQTRKCRIVKQNRFIPFSNFVSFSFRNRKSHGIVFARLYLLLV